MVPLWYFLTAGFGFVTFASLFRPRLFRFLVISSGVGCAVGYGLTFLGNLNTHSFKAVSEPIRLREPPANFNIISQRIFEHLTESYNELGQLDMGEEHVTVKPNVFAQMGVVDIDDVRKLWSSVIMPQLRLCMGGNALLNRMEMSTIAIENDTVFCDIGSGVGNVCLQVLAETHCKKVVGVEVIPSRQRNATIAFERAKKYYPEYFDAKNAIFLQGDLVNYSSRLIEEKVNVIFTHSWMFDDELMRRLTEVVASVPTVFCVVTSRKLNDKLLADHPLKLVSRVHLRTDWNDEAPFYVYRKQL
ncbi:Tcc1i14-2.2 [Trypanosoma grayi]|uniref:Tcc1i14-2.2 n=1 Tax=Trypanosoma grayi TaxID=71804 RepID=UPI0004F46934|nr:Tcc1i14-2.2 [Trypanosoma grayi]KEG11625.1 Tcc1i14-2.2 [Trypanosoma grayi]